MAKLSSSRNPAEVVLQIYDVSHDDRLAKLNEHLLKLPGLGKSGIFHAAVEVGGVEYSFGQTEPGFTGIFACEPRTCPDHSYRESHVMGETKLSETQILELLERMEKDWPGDGYDLLKRNCCTFSNEFCIALGVGPIPQWVHSLAVTGAKAMNAATKARKFIKSGTDKLRQTGSRIDEQFAITQTVAGLDEKYRIKDSAKATAKNAGQKIMEFDEAYKVRETTGKLVQDGVTAVSGLWNRVSHGAATVNRTKC